MIIKLASALNMTHSELERELKNSVIGTISTFLYIDVIFNSSPSFPEQNSGTDQETCSIVTKSVLDLLSNAYWQKNVCS